MVNDPDREAFLQLMEQRPDVGGRFINIRRISPDGGKGHFSAIFTAVDSQTGETVALKFYYHGRNHNDYRWNCFVREAQLLEQLRAQPDIVRQVASRSEVVVPLTAPGGLVIPVSFSYYAAELASCSVTDKIEEGTWSALDRLNAFRAMCRAVQRLHRLLITHRDLKPGNFLVLLNGHVRLADFGTARQLGDATALLDSYQGFPPGDVWYTAPEILAGLHDVDSKFAYLADIFALGAILFELFSGVVLGSQIYGGSYVDDLIRVGAAIPRARRKSIYDAIVGSIADRSLPSVSAFGVPVPNSIKHRIDALYKSMAALDYRRRLQDFEQIFHQINMCTQFAQREVQYRRLQEFRRRRQEGRLGRQEAVQQRWDTRVSVDSGQEGRG